MSETSWDRGKYRMKNWKAYNAALKARGRLTVWQDKDMQWLAPPTGKRGRGHTFSDASIQLCLTIKCLFGQTSLQTLGLVQSLLKMAGLPWTAPDYITLCRRQKILGVQVHYRESTAGLHVIADSTWIKFLGESEWKTKKHGAECRREWGKVDLGIDAQPLQIRPIAVTTSEVGDTPMAAELHGQIPSHEEVASVTGDVAYDTQDVHEACYWGGAISIFTPHKGKELCRGVVFAHRNEAVKACRHLGRAICCGTRLKRLKRLLAK
ncbi:hypothetical protein M2375_002335 [Comamonas sp. BIGb0152]|nr:hypothetical protein [Comamonas sp. BIGb0152]